MYVGDEELQEWQALIHQQSPPESQGMLPKQPASLSSSVVGPGTAAPTPHLAAASMEADDEFAGMD